MKKLTICFAIIVALAFSHNTFAGKWYWVPTSDNTWGVNANGQVDSTSWSMTSGGSGGQGYPGANDTVYFDANSFNQDVNTVFIHGTVSAFVVDMSGLSGLPFSPVYMQSYSDPQTYAYNDTINILGRLIFNANMNISGFYGRMNLHTNSSDTLSLSNQNYLQFSIGLYGGSWTLGSNLSFINNGNAGSDGSFSLYKGVSFNLNGYSLLVNGFTVQDTMVSITMPKGSTLQVSSIFDLSQHSPKISMDPGTLINLEVNYSDTKLRLGNYGQSTFNGGALKYSNVSCFTNTIITGANTFDTLRLYNGDSIYLANSDTQRFTYLYSYANNGNFNAINGGPNMATLQSLSGSRECLNYTNFTNIKAQGAKFYIYGGTYIDTAGFTLVPSLMDTINKSVNISAGCRNGLNAQIAAGATGGLPPYSFVWYNFTTQISDTVHQDTLKTAISGATYSVSVVDQCGQIYAHLNSIVVNNLNTDTIAPAVVPNDTILCGTGHSVLLYANTQTSNVSYLWSPAAGIPNTTVDSNQVTVYQTTTYKVQLTRGTCVQIDSINVTVENPKAKVSVDTLNVCQGNTFTLDGSNSTGLVAGYNPLWTNNSQTAYFPDSLKVTGNAYVAGTTVYYLKLFGDNSCLSVDSVVVNVSDSITGATTSRDTILCGLSHAIYLTASTTNQPKVNFTWSPTIGLGATQGDSTLLTPVKTTTYTATFTNGACILKKEVNVAVQNPVATISPDTLTVCQGALVTLDAQSSSGYTLTPSWTNNKKISLNLTNELQPTFTANSLGNTTFYLQLSTSACKSIDSVMVTVIDSVNHISGRATYNDGTGIISKGYAFLYKDNGSNKGVWPVIDSVALNSDGTFAFDSTLVNTGRYITRIYPDTALFPLLPNMYYLQSKVSKDTSANLWDSATTVLISCGQSIQENIDIHQLPDLKILGGSGIISGTVAQGLGYVAGAPVHHKGSNNPIVQGANDPIGGVGVSLGRKPNPAADIYSTTTTSSKGVFVFTHVPVGDYVIFADIPGLPMDSAYNVSIVNPKDSIGNNNYLVNDTVIYIPANTSPSGIATTQQNAAYLSTYPNPFSGIVNMNFSLTATSSVVLEVYNMLGEKIQTLEQNSLESGMHHYTFDSKGLAASMYLVKLTVNNVIYTRRIVEVKQ